MLASSLAVLSVGPSWASEPVPNSSTGEARLFTDSLFEGNSAQPDSNNNISVAAAKAGACDIATSLYGDKPVTFGITNPTELQKSPETGNHRTVWYMPFLSQRQTRKDRTELAI